MDYACLEKLCIHANVPIPNVKLVPRFQHTSTAGKKGANAMLKKYGRIPVDEAVRLKYWREWWKTNGQYRDTSILKPKAIHTPRKCASLAEFMGIMMGDGTVSAYHIAVTLHITDDAAYGKHVVKLIEELFKIKPNVYLRPDISTRVIVVPRKLLSEYLSKLGLPMGNKVSKGISIPDWIKANKKYTQACIRGLMDTDGSVFDHCYVSKGKKYCYKKLSFSSASPSLCSDVAGALSSSGITISCYGRNVRIESEENVRRYFKIFDSHNPKHLKRYAR